MRFFIYKILDNMLTVSLRNKIVIVAKTKATDEAGRKYCAGHKRACFMKALKRTIANQDKATDFYIVYLK